jgi:hypothetical protein
MYFIAHESVAEIVLVYDILCSYLSKALLDISAYLQ